MTWADAIDALVGLAALVAYGFALHPPTPPHEGSDTSSNGGRND